MQIGNVEIKLSRVLNVDGEARASLTMREPLVEDQLVAAESSGSDAIKEITFMANLCGVAPSVIRKLPMRDYEKVKKAYSGFTSDD